MVFGRRMAVTSFCLLLGGCALARFRFVFWVHVLLFCRCCFCRWCLFFSVSLYVWVWLTSLGFFFCWGLFCGDCFLLCVWLMMAFVGCCYVGFVCFSRLSRLAGFCVFRTSTFSPLLPYFCVVRRLWLLAYCCLLPAPSCFILPVFWRSLPC